MARSILQRSLHAATTAVRGFLLGAFVAASFAWPVLAAQDDDVQPDLNALRAKAQAGSVTAQTQLADFLIASDDFTNAVGWYRKAAEQGDLTAQLSLASLLLAGRGVAKNPQEAAKWLRAAADRIETNRPAFGPGAIMAATTNVPANPPSKAIIITRTNSPPPPRVPSTNAAAVMAAPTRMPPATNPPALTRVQRAGVANPADPALHEVQPVLRPSQEPR
jgi:hypothetical protein